MDRSRVEELVTLYQLEPGIRDVYVEGGGDRAILAWFLVECGAPAVSVKEIGDVEVPPQLLVRRGCENSNRGRATALALELSSILGKDSRSATCVVDADFDRVLGRDRNCELLLLTDYSCMEMYFFEARTISKLAGLALLGFPRTGDQVIADLSAPLLDLFSVRLANFLLRWNLEGISFQGCLSLGPDGVRLHLDEYVRNYLVKNARLGERTVFMEAVRESRKRADGDARHYINGHDFVSLLIWYVRQHKGFGGVHPQTIWRSLFSCADSAALSEQVLFGSILRRVR